MSQPSPSVTIPKTTKEIQQFLSDRGVPYSNIRKAGLQQLVQAALKYDIELDPDGVKEDRQEVLDQKLRLLEGGKCLPHPSTLTPTCSLIHVADLQIADIYNYQLQAKEEYSFTAPRKHWESDAWQMMVDNHVLEIKSAHYDGTVFNLVTSKVKPRTRSDPSYYNVWKNLPGSQQAAAARSFMSARYKS